ncbi:MAG: ABC transporter substrate-binding protein [Candidatus Eremiobacteraeota bacterium]|nr:ABC transporter substrate-binding protein [Candidatus Eremiobacteraeota bacterium]
MIRNLRSRVACAIAAVCVLAFSACSSQPAGNSTLVFGRNKDAVRLDPAVVTDGMSLNVARLTMEGLTAYGSGSFAIRPALATSWTASPDGKTWIFTLRHGVKFQDGTAFDAQAVKVNFDRWRLPNDPLHQTLKGDYSYYESQFGGFPGVIAGVRVLAPDKVQLRLTKPLAPLLANLAMPSFAMSSPAAMRSKGEDYFREPIGTGPYQVVEWVKDDHITLRAFDGYWGPKPRIATVVLRDLPDAASSLIALQKGEIDGWEYPQPNDLPRIAQERDLHIYHMPPNNVMYLAMNNMRRPFDNLLVRRAINEAIDAKAIVKNFYDPTAVVADEFLPAAVWPHGVRVSYPYDPADARRLLAKAGYPNGFATTLWYMTLPRPYLLQPQRVAEAIQANLRAVGIQTTLQGFEWGTYLDRVMNGEADMALYGWSGDNGDPDNYLYVLMDKDSAATPGAQNVCFWKDQRFHDLMMQAQVTTGRAARSALYDRALDIMHDQAPCVPLVHTSPPIAFNVKVKGYVPHPDSAELFQDMWIGK